MEFLHIKVTIYKEKEVPLHKIYCPTKDILN
jgi:hypothetical protein